MSEELKNITKICTKCEIEQPLENFGRQTKSPDGYKNYCKSCFSEINKGLYTKNKKKIIKNVLRRRKEKTREEKQQKIQLKKAAKIDLETVVSPPILQVN